MNSPVDFTSATNVAPFCRDEISRASITPTLSAKIFVRRYIDDAATVAVAVESKADVGFVLQDGVAHGMQHLHVSVLG